MGEKWGRDGGKVVVGVTIGVSVIVGVWVKTITGVRVICSPPPHPYAPPNTHTHTPFPHTLHPSPIQHTLTLHTLHTLFSPSLHPPTPVR